MNKIPRRDFIKTAGGLILLAGATLWPTALAQTVTKPPGESALSTGPL